MVSGFTRSQQVTFPSGVHSRHSHRSQPPWAPPPRSGVGVGLANFSEHDNPHHSLILFFYLPFFNKVLGQFFAVVDCFVYFVSCLYFGGKKIHVCTSNSS